MAAWNFGIFANLDGSNDIIGKPKRCRYDTVVVRLERLVAGDLDGFTVHIDCCPYKVLSTPLHAS